MPSSSPLVALGARARLPASSVFTISSTSNTHPPQTPPLASCSAAHRRVSAGSFESGRRSARAARAARTSAPSAALKRHSPSPTRFTLPSNRFRSITISIQSPSRSLPIGPAARASGDTCPMHAPAENPLNRASVRRATCLPNCRYRSADVNCEVSSMPAPIGPRQASTRMSPGRTVLFLMAAMASGSVKKTLAGPVFR